MSRNAYLPIAAILAKIARAEAGLDSKSSKFFAPTVPGEAVDATVADDPAQVSKVLRLDEIFKHNCKRITKKESISRGKITQKLMQLLEMPVCKGAARERDQPQRPETRKHPRNTRWYLQNI